MSEYVIPEINQALCTGCGDCLAACQPHALALVAGKAVVARPDLCEYDGGCEPICPEGAIQLPYLIVFGSLSATGQPSPLHQVGKALGHSN